MNNHNRNSKSPLNIHHLELVRLRIGYINDCPFSIRLHYKELINFGETHLRLCWVASWEIAPCFSLKERSLFALTDYTLCSEKKMSFTQIQGALKCHVSNLEINHLIRAIQQIDLWTRSMKYSNAISEKGNDNT